MVHSGSKFFVAEYSAPVVGTSYQAYPIDVCVIYEIVLDGVTAKNHYGMFSCNGTNEVTFKSYGENAGCTGDAEGSQTYTDTSIKPGEPHSFNCSGAVNYMVTDGCQAQAGKGNNQTCCSKTECLPSTQVTDVCVDNQDGTYSMVNCNAFNTSTW
eukprot:CAMPEP_0202705884 /NCGR_PEP_ID=MMETSP1385-20130828/18384_1 /ASSEMBLY_ACC=CAM_ASM_000861 /TAXON_ID=933848 /ORGANISM="Elphidium margaritaceum" /LENGTH=154 /DNA_ID=CAMNT_0049364227 /DNA_START=83 /DNA_END=544 /DNA_ORIENTATION=-